MKKPTRSFILIAFNFLLLGACASILGEEYFKDQPFQWVDPNAIEDHEEIYLLPICAALSVLIILSSLHELAMRFTNANPIMIFIQNLLRMFSYIYASILLLGGSVLLITSMTLMNNSQFILELLLILVVALSTIFIGGFIIYHNQQEHESLY